MRTAVQNSEADIEEIIEGHESRNEALRQTLVAKGIDLGEPRVIECHFWAWSEENAASLAEDVVRQGFQILVRRPADSVKDPKLWNVEAAIKQSIELTLRREFTDELVRTAARHLGKYDGWGTSL
jgi:regulator of RNase E activity RraB